MPTTLHLTIPNACHENWHDMKPEEKGRYCNSCRKQVVDFTNMSDGEVLRHLSQTGGGVCGRLHADQLNRPITARPERSRPWLKYFFQITLPAFLVSLKTQGQNCKKPEIVQVEQKQQLLGEAVFFSQAPGVHGWVVQGTVVDQTQQPLVGATVVVKGTKQGTYTDTAGHFSLSFTEEKEIVLVIGYIGFVQFEVKAMPAMNQLKNIKLTMSPMIMGDVVVVGLIIPRTKKPRRSALEIARSIITPDSVKVFPNPVGIGNDIKVEMNVKERGRFFIEVSDVSGRLVKRQSIEAKANFFTSAVNTDQLLPGNYIVCVRDRKGKKIGVKKIIVQ